MNAATFSKTLLAMVLTASAATLQANGPMGGTSTTAAPSSGNSGTRGQGGSRGSSGVRINPGTRVTRGPRPANQGVTVCYDYAYYRGTNNCPAGHYLGPDDLRNHRSVKYSTVYPRPMDAAGHYRPGDWLVTSGGHAGYVNSRGGIDHFHQVYGHSGTLYPNPGNLPAYRPGQGGLYLNDNLDHFLNSGFRTPANQNVRVLHR
jgi:hypothetical protein